jgi:hypothetical protein
VKHHYFNNNLLAHLAHLNIEGSAELLLQLFGITFCRSCFSGEEDVDHRPAADLLPVQPDSHLDGQADALQAEGPLLSLMGKLVGLPKHILVKKSKMLDCLLWSSLVLLVKVRAYMT